MLRGKNNSLDLMQVHLHQQDPTDCGGTICKVEHVLIFGIDLTSHLYQGQEIIEKILTEHHSTILLSKIFTYIPQCYPIFSYIAKFYFLAYIQIIDFKQFRLVFVRPIKFVRHLGHHSHLKTHIFPVIRSFQFLNKYKRIEVLLMWIQLAVGQ